MNSIYLLTYLERRQLGFAEPRKNVYDMFIGQLGYKSRDKKIFCSTCQEQSDVGNTFACKFSRNKNNLHILGCSTEHGELIIGNTLKESNPLQYKRNAVHTNAIFNFAWAEPQMTLVTACGDQTSKLCNLHPSGTLDKIREFVNVSSVRSVMFCPGSSDVFCGGCQDGSIKIWDARMNNGNSVLKFDCNIPNAHGNYGSGYKNKKSRKMFGISTVIYQNDLTVLSCSSMDPCIKLWDLRKSYRQVIGIIEPLPLTKYFHDKHDTLQNIGYTDMITNPQSTRLYASGINNIIYCYSLVSSERMPICQYSGHRHETTYSKISISNDGRYLFSGCISKTGVIWLTDLPSINEPVFEIINNVPCCEKELSISDWCADSSSLKLAVSSDSMPMLCSILPLEHSNALEFKISKTASYKSKSFSKILTVPIKPELKKIYLKETEENMENWDFQKHNTVSAKVDNLPVTPKRQWEMLFTKTVSPTASQMDTTLTHSSPVASNQIPDVVTPVSNKKRKKSMLSPRCLIDQYLVPKSKREKMDPVKEM